MHELELVISAAPAFANLEPRHLRLVVDCAHREHAAPGTFLTREGELAERFFLLERGAVSLEVASAARGPLVITTLHDGELLGWSWLFAPYRWRIDGRVITPTSVISFDGVRLREACESDHELGYRLLTRFAGIAVERLQETRLQLLDIYANPVLR